MPDHWPVVITIAVHSKTPRLPSSNQEENPINSLKTNNQNNTKQFLEKLGQLGLECGKGESGLNSYGSNF